MNTFSTSLPNLFLSLSSTHHHITHPHTTHPVS